MFAQALFRFARQQVNGLDPCVPFQQVYACSTQHGDVDAVVVRIAVIEHDNRLAAGPQHTMDLTNGCSDVGRVVEYTVRVDNVKRVVWEIECFGVRNLESTREVKQFEAPSC